MFGLPGLSVARSSRPWPVEPDRRVRKEGRAVAEIGAVDIEAEGMALPIRTHRQLGREQVFGRALRLGGVLGIGVPATGELDCRLQIERADMNPCRSERIEIDHVRAQRHDRRLDDEIGRHIERPLQRHRPRQVDKETPPIEAGQRAQRGGAELRGRHPQRFLAGHRDGSRGRVAGPQPYLKLAIADRHEAGHAAAGLGRGAIERRSGQAGAAGRTGGRVACLPQLGTVGLP